MIQHAMLPTPDTAHLNFDNIYEPSEDSFLLLDTVSLPSEIAFIGSRYPHDSEVPLVLEVGPGSGVVLAFITANAQTIFGRADVLTAGVDVNGFACKGTAETVSHSIVDIQNAPVIRQADPSHGHWRTGVFADCVQGDLTSCIRRGIVDVLIFNPPYVPSEDLPQVIPDDSIEEAASASRDTFARDSRLLALATDGGIDGMEITNKLLGQLEDVLSDRGIAYILLCAQNKPEAVKQRIRDWGPVWDVETVHTSGKQGGWERLQIIRISRSVTS